ncbi:MAG: hypothetical protein JW940_02580 [Polyangiaceae bacterium]|nr:hypothetical protein [Polyangiaceae bacterium]
MKTTLEVSDVLLTRAKTLAAREGTTIRALVEEGLRRVLDERKGRGRFRLRDASFGGNGVQSGQQESNWAEVRELIYEGRGG